MLVSGRTKEANLKLSCLKEQLEVSYKEKGEKLYEEIFSGYMKYWNEVTGGDNSSTK